MTKLSQKSTWDQKDKDVAESAEQESGIATSRPEQCEPRPSLDEERVQAGDTLEPTFETVTQPGTLTRLVRGLFK